MYQFYRQLHSVLNIYSLCVQPANMSVVNYSGMISDTVSIHVLVTVQPPHVKLTTGKNARQTYLYVIAYLLVLATSYINVKLLEYVSCVPLSNYLLVCLGIQLKGKTTFMSFFVSYIRSYAWTTECISANCYFSYTNRGLSKQI